MKKTKQVSANIESGRPRLEYAYLIDRLDMPWKNNIEIYQSNASVYLMDETVNNFISATVIRDWISND